MPFCSQCGRPLGDGEVCGCTANADTAQPQQTDYSQSQNNGQQQFYNQPQYPNQQPYPQGGYYQQYPNQPYQKKKSHAWVLAIIIPVAVLFLVVIAIIVPAAIGYNRKSNQLKCNNLNSKTLIYCESALNSMDLNNSELEGTYIISSEKSRNIGVPFATDEFYEKYSNFREVDENLCYFIVVENGDVRYCASSEGWNEKHTGTFPTSPAYPRYYSASGFGDEADASCSLDDLYQDAKTKINR